MTSDKFSLDLIMLYEWGKNTALKSYSKIVSCHIFHLGGPVIV